MFNQDGWTKFQNRAQKWDHSVSLSNFHVASLTAISRWVLVRIVYRDEVDVDVLSRTDVQRIVTKEICEPSDPVETEAPTLAQ